MRPQPAFDAAIGAGLAQCVGIGFVGVKRNRAIGAHRRFARQRAGLLVGGGQFAGLDLAGFDVGLIERIDADHRAGDGGGDLEAEKFLAEMGRGILHDANDRMAGLLQFGELGFVVGLALAFERQVDEEAVVAVDFRPGQRLAIDRDQAFAVLAGRIRRTAARPRRRNLAGPAR